MSEAKLREALNTTAADGTKPLDMVRYLRRAGLQVTSGKLTAQDLRDAADRKAAVIIALQAWADEKNPDYRSDQNGHYVVLRGHTARGFTFADPSSHKPTFLTEEQLLTRWHDRDSDGRKYVQLGIVAESRTPRVEQAAAEPILMKAKGDPRADHKYKSRKPDGKGGWLYEYDEPSSSGVAAKRSSEPITQDTIKRFKSALPDFKKRFDALGVDHEEPYAQMRAGVSQEEAFAERDKKVAVAAEQFEQLRSDLTKYINTVEGLAKAVGREDERTGMDNRLQTAMASMRRSRDQMFPRWREYDEKGDLKAQRPDLQKMQRERDALWRTARKHFGDALDAIEARLVSHTSAVFHHEERVQRAGFTFLVEQGSARVREYLDDYLPVLDRTRDALKRAGVARVFEGARFAMADRREGKGEGLTAGVYSADRDLITLYTLAIADHTDTKHSTLIHELGHRYFSRALPPNAKAAWNEHFDSMSVKVDAKKIDAFADLLRSVRGDGAGPYWQQHDDLTDAVVAAGDPVFAQLEDQLPLDWTTQKIEDVVTRLKNNALHEEDSADKRAFKEPLTDYARTNADEAFAEAFMTYVLHGAQALSPGWRHGLEQTMRAAGDTMRKAEPRLAISLRKAGPFIGPKGGKWADSAHTIPWTAEHEHAQGVRDLSDRLTEKHGVKLSLTHGKGVTTLHGVAVPKDKRGQGVGDAVMHAIKQHADEHGHRIILTADPTFAGNKGSKARLVKWYKRHGFVENKGRNKDFTVSAGMYREPVKKSFAIEPVLTIALRKAGPPAGFTMAPNSKHGGYRKKVGGKWVYWYEGDAATTTVKPQWSEANFAAGKFDKNPEHWSWKLTQQRMIGGVSGGVDLHSKHPVKIAGMPHRLWQIVEAEKQPGWAQLRDVKNGEKKLIEHERVMPVQWQIASKPVQSVAERDSEDEGEDKEPYDPTAGEPDEGPITGYAGKRIPPFEASVAPEGTALWSIENGSFQFKAVQRIIADADGVPRKVKRIEPFVPDAVKVKLISEFEPLLRSAAKQTYKSHALKPTMQIGPTGRPENMTMQDLQTSATEGLLRALQHYPGGMSFAAFAKHYVHGHVRVEAGRMRLGGVKLAEREQRMLPGFIAARASAGRKSGVDNPSAEQVAAHWKLLKRDLHRGLSSAQGTQPVPMGAYQLRGEGAGGPKSLQHYPGKAELAERLLGLLEGERATSSGPDETEGELFPGTGGRGLDTEAKISTQHEIKNQLKQLEEHTITSGPVTYRMNTAKVLTRLLGLDGGDPATVAKIVREVPIESKSGDKWKTVASARQQHTIMQRFVDEGLKWLRKEFEGSDIEGVIGQAGEKHGSREVIPSGPTYNEIIRERATKVTPEQVSAWRKTEGERLRAMRDRHAHELSQHEPGTPEHGNAKMLVSQVDDAISQIKKVGHRTIALRVVLDSQRESDEMRKLQTQTVTVEPQSRVSDYHEVYMTDAAGNQRKVRVRKVGRAGDPWSEPIGTFNKSEGSALTSGMLAEHMRWPLVTRALYAPTDRLALLPTQARLHLEGLVGLT